MISNCLRPTRHRAQMCVQSALPLFGIGSRLRGQVFPRRLPALRGNTPSLVGRTLHTKSITKCNEKQNGTPANFENAPKFSCICLAVFPTVMKNKTECPKIFKKMDLKNETNFTPIGTILTHIGTILTSFGHHFDPIGDQRRKSSFFCRKHCVLRGCFS